jgi:tetratricopeptide (TPR) repeat protein
MAKKEPPASEPPVTPEFSDADKARARQWFKKAADCRERREYDYAIECYITGLGYWPEAVEEGHMPLRSLAIQRQQVGGKKPGLMEGLKRSMSGKDAKQGLFNAEHLLSMDPQNGSYAEGLLKNAIKAGFLETAKWVAPICFEALKKDKKLNKSHFKGFRDALVEAAGLAEARGDSTTKTWMLEHAVSSLEYLIMRTPADEELRNEQRDLAGKLTISRGKYEDAGDFRDSLQDAEKQKMLHDADRVKQGDQTLEALIAAARREWEAAPDSVAKLSVYIDALVKGERKPQEDEAIAVLMTAYETSHNYSLKMRADDIRLRQLDRQARTLAAKAQQSGAEEDRQQGRLALLEQRQVALEAYRERVAKYPTDLRLKYKFGALLFGAGEYDEAIPVLQVAQGDLRSRHECQLLIGRAFFEKGSPGQAIEVLREAISHYELTDDFSKKLLYWLGRAYEADGNTEEAKAAYGKLLRQDYNYMDGDARNRLEKLK